MDNPSFHCDRDPLNVENEPIEPIVVPHAELSAAALRAVVESFVLREGTEYGEHDFSLDQKVAQVMVQLDRGEARVIYDPNSDSIDIVGVSSNLRR